MINKIKNRWMAGRGRKLCSALLLAALPLGSVWAANNDMAFTAKIKPWGTSSFDFTILNETLEPITAITVSMDGTDHKFEYLYSRARSRRSGTRAGAVLSERAQSARCARCGRGWRGRTWPF
jgi:hypothetical protein